VWFWLNALIAPKATHSNTNQITVVFSFYDGFRWSANTCSSDIQKTRAGLQKFLSEATFDIRRFSVPALMAARHVDVSLRAWCINLL
jgi:hypothetical protein